MAVTWPSKADFANGDVLTATNMNNIGDTLNVFNPTSATNGQVWTANGSGSGSYTTLSSGAFTLLDSSSLATLTTKTVSGIAGTYRALYFSLENLYAASTSYFSMNLNTGGAYNSISFRQGPSNTTATTEATYDAGSFTVSGADGRAIGTLSTQPTRIVGFVYDYASDKKQPTIQLFINRYPAASYATGGFQQTTGAAITSVKFDFSSALTAGTLNLYGVK